MESAFSLGEVPMVGVDTCSNMQEAKLAISRPVLIGEMKGGFLYGLR